MEKCAVGVTQISSASAGTFLYPTCIMINIPLEEGEETSFKENDQCHNARRKMMIFLYFFSKMKVFFGKVFPKNKRDHSKLTKNGEKIHASVIPFLENCATAKIQDSTFRQCRFSRK